MLGLPIISFKTARSAAMLDLVPNGDSTDLDTMIACLALARGLVARYERRVALLQEGPQVSPLGVLPLQEIIQGGDVVQERSV